MCCADHAHTHTDLLLPDVVAVFVSGLGYQVFQGRADEPLSVSVERRRRHRATPAADRVHPDLLADLRGRVRLPSEEPGTGSAGRGQVGQGIRVTHRIQSAY